MEWIGKLKFGYSGIDLPQVYEKLYKEDLSAARILFNGGFYRQSAYLILQCLEKLLKSKIFSKVNGEHDYYRRKNSNHNLQDTVDFLIDIVTLDPLTKESLKKQLYSTLNVDVIRTLNNNLRYPNYSKKYQNYTLLDISKNDVLRMFEMHDRLEMYLKNL